MTRDSEKDIEIHVPALARVEGEGALHIKTKDGKLDTLQLEIYEPPRLFEKLLENRSYQEIPDIVARICGICPVAYQMSAVHAIESAFQFTSNPWIDSMRRVLYCGEWIQSHSLHIHLLALPDYFGHDSVIGMADTHPEQVNRGLRLQQMGNQIIGLLGGRSVHPIGVCAGGFYTAPTIDQVNTLLQQIRQCQTEAEALVEWVASFDLNQHQASEPFLCVSLSDNSYPMIADRIVSNTGLDISISEFEQYFQESQVSHSTALYAHLQGQPYLVGPLARLNLNVKKLPSQIQQLLSQLKINFPSYNMFHSMLARSIEIYYALIEAESILKNYALPMHSRMDVQTHAATGFGCSEAPRGLLWHRYNFNHHGEVLKARIVPPTSQNQARIEQDLRQTITAFGLHNKEEDIRLLGEKIIRNYDPCISCATHFLKLDLEHQ